MQDRYTGDIGDYAKYGLLRALCAGMRLGVAWYLCPDEDHNTDGRHIDYLDRPGKWRCFDPGLFDGLKNLVGADARSVASVERSGLLGDAVFSRAPLAFEGRPDERARARGEWFRGVMNDLASCDVVFADPDNGLARDAGYRPDQRRCWKSIPLAEVHVLARGRTAIVYHHNTHAAGGHAREIAGWLDQLGPDAIAVYWRGYSNRTFFVVNPTREILARADRLVRDWAGRFELHRLSPCTLGGPSPARSMPPTGSGGPANAAPIDARKRCPLCDKVFEGPGWGGIDAHWKAEHEHLMPYAQAWPYIKAGLNPLDPTGTS